MKYRSTVLPPKDELSGVPSVSGVTPTAVVAGAAAVLLVRLGSPTWSRRSDTTTTL